MPLLAPDHARPRAALPGSIHRLLGHCLVGVGLAAAFWARAADPTPAADQTATVQRIASSAMASHWAYERLGDLTDLIGPRLSGSAGAAAAVEQVAAALRAAGLEVRLDPVMVPHWERGVETAELVDYPRRPAGITQRVVLTALGGSGATPAAGITAPVVVVHDFDELAARGDAVRGSIVLFDVPFRHDLVDHGQAGPAYGETVKYRLFGPARAASLGAVAALVRSLGSADFRLPHTGATVFGAGVAPIPAAAVSVEDALLITRLGQRGGPVRLHLTLTPRLLPDAPSHNVLAEIPGSDPGAGIVLVSGHLDSWDLAQGAIDDGAGVVAAMATVELLHSLHLRPRRTIRFVAWMNEENGSRGAQAYGATHREELPRHVAAIESDAGAGHTVGILSNAPASATAYLTPLMSALEPFGAGVLRQDIHFIGSDLAPLEEAGVPAFEPIVDGTHYFDYHHTPADTLDKVVEVELQGQVAAMASLAWFLATTPDPLARLEKTAR